MPTPAPPVRILMALMSLMAALTLTGLGAASAWAIPVEAAPCHEAAASAVSSHHSTDDSPPATPEKAKVMACCIACVAVVPVAPVSTPLRTARPGVEPRLQAVRTGRIPSPEPEPPKS